MQSCEYNTLQIRQYIGGGKRNYNPKSESSIWEKFTNSDVDEMECIIREEILVKNEGNDTNSTNTTTSPVIVALEQDMTDEKDPDTYYLFLAFPSLPTPDFHDENNDGAVAAGGCDGAMARQFRRRVRVPLVAFCELLAKAFEAHITSTTLCFVADASCGMGSDILSTIVKRCNYGVVSGPPHTMMFLILIDIVSSLTAISNIDVHYIIICAVGDHCRSVLDDILSFTRVQKDASYHIHGSVRAYCVRLMSSRCMACSILRRT